MYLINLISHYIMKKVHIKWLKNRKTQTINCKGMETVHDILCCLDSHYRISIRLYYDSTYLESTMPLDFLPDGCMLLCEPAILIKLTEFNYFVSEESVKINKRNEQQYHKNISAVYNFDKTNKISAKCHLQRNGYVKERIHYYNNYYEKINDISLFNLFDIKFNNQLYVTELNKIKCLLTNIKKENEKIVDNVELDSYAITEPNCEFAKAYFIDLCSCISQIPNNETQIYMLRSFLNYIFHQKIHHQMWNNNDIRLLKNIKHEHSWLNNMVSHFNYANPDNTNIRTVLCNILALQNEIIAVIESYLTKCQKKRYYKNIINSFFRMFQRHLMEIHEEENTLHLRKSLVIIR